MGIFNKTEEEKKKELEQKKLTLLRDEISYSEELDQFTTNFLVEYLNGVIFGTRKNDFFDTDFLVRVVNQLNANQYIGDIDVEQYLNRIISALHDFFPYEKYTENYDFKKEYFINNVVGQNGFINKGIYDHHIFNITKNLDSYARIMTTISSNDKAVKEFNLVKQYINETGKYAYDEESLVKAVVSTIYGLDESVLDVEQYLNGQLDEDKKRVGVYSVSHDDIMTAYKNIRIMNAIMEKANEIIDEVEKKSDSLSKIAQDSIDDINLSKETSLGDIERKKKSCINDLNLIKVQILSELKRKLLDSISLEEKNFNLRLDSVFSDILIKYQDQLSEFARDSKNISLENSRNFKSFDSDLSRIKNELQECISKAKESSSIRDELKDYLDKIEADAEFRDKLLESISKEKESSSSIEPADDEIVKVVKGINRLVVPTTPNIDLPDSIIIPKNIQIISPYIFKTANEFDKKLKLIKNKMDEKEAQGEIYHKKILEIIRCLMVGDWPYMFGPSGAGKGYIVKQIGDLLGQKVIDGGKIGDVHTVLGYIDARGRFMAPPAVEACVNGGLIFFDEFDNGNADTRVALNTMYSNLRNKIQDPSSNQFIQFANEQIPISINPNMRMIAAGNTDGTGSDENYSERYHIDESIKERYKPIYVGYDNRVEAQILRDYKNWYEFFVLFRDACEEYASSQGLQSTPGNASTRDASDILRDVSLNSKTLDEVMCQYFVQIKDSDYRNAIAREIAEHYGIDINQSNINDYSGTLADANRYQIAEQFVKRCNLGLRR